MGIKISEMTAVANATGNELLPASVSDAPRRVSVAQVKDYTLAAAAAITPASGVSSSDGVFILQGGALKPVDIDEIAGYAVDTVWSGAADASPSGTDIIISNDGSSDQTVTLAVLAEYIRGAIEAAILDISNIDTAISLASTDYLLVTQGSTAKKTTLAEINTAIYAGLSAYVSALTAVTVSADSDVLYCLQGGVQKKVTLAQIKTLFGVSGAAVAPPSTTENNVPQWDAVSKQLKDGVPIVNSVAASGGTGSGLVTETGIRAAINSGLSASSYLEKTTPVDGDSVAVSDSEDSDKTKSVLLSSLKSFFLAAVEAVFPAATKASVVDADKFVIQDSEDASASKSVLWSVLKDAMSGYVESVIAGRANHTSLLVADKIPIYSGGNPRTVTLETLDSRYASAGGGGLAYSSVLNPEPGGGSYELSEMDVSSLVMITEGGANNVVVPRDSVYNFDVGTIVDICQAGAGQITVAKGDASMELRAETGLKSSGQYGVLRVVKVAADDWLVTGGVA